MNNLLFTALLIALLYYFFYYLPSPKKLNAQPLPLPHHQSTQTEELETKITNYEPGSNNTLNCPGPIRFPSDQSIPDPEAIKKLELEKAELVKDIQQKNQDIIGLNNSYQKLETNSKNEIDNLKNQITNLQTQIRELVKRPLKPTNSKSIQTDSEVELTNTLDTLIKGIQELNNEL
jgi:ABC-type uncharacterized transport system involved in gliding motility auxiliary subunit